jgi:C-terminal binding protein
MAHGRNSLRPIVLLRSSFVAQLFHVAVADFLREPLVEERRILGDIACVEALDAMCEEDLFGRIERADAIMLYHFVTLGEAVISRLERCRLIVRCGVGVDNIDREAAARRGIPVANVPDYGAEEVADSAIGMLLSLTRGINFFNSRMRLDGSRWTYETGRPLVRLRGRKLGIVGLGRIGVATALRAKSLGMQVLFYDPYLPDGVDKALGVTRVDPGSYLVNTARGAVVDAGAVLVALESGHLAGAALDVLVTEPPSEEDPLLVAWRDSGHVAHDRLILNPHSAFYCEEGLLEMRTKGSENCRRALLGERIRNVVNGVAVSSLVPRGS